MQPITRSLLTFLLLTAAASRARCADVAIRVATFNVSLYGQNDGDVLKRLKDGDDSQARHVAEIIQRVRPDVLLLNEIDYDVHSEVLDTFCEKYLAVGQHVSRTPAGPAEPIAYPHRWAAPSNTGRASGFDLDRDGKIERASGSDAYAADCWGYGRYEGQYALAVLSKYPIDVDGIRTFREFRWKDMPGARLPDDPSTAAPADWYSAEALEKFPLSSKNHCDIPLKINGATIHLLVCHPTPPVYDGPEDRNGRRNYDELRFWADYVGGEESGVRGQESGDSRRERGSQALETSNIKHRESSIQHPRYIYDDKGRRGDLDAEESFIILGDLNSDPLDGDGPEGIRQLLASPRIQNYPPPESPGGAEQARLQGGANRHHRGLPQHDTCDPADEPGPGNLRIDYVLPSADLKVASSAVFWPAADDPLFPLVGTFPFPGSDHRLVWVDLELEVAGSE